MKFNESKLETTTTWFYTLNSVILQHMHSAKYLGIRIHKSLRFSEHINATTKKCSQCLGFFQRTLRQCPQEIRELAYIREDPESSREVGEWSQTLPAN